MWHNLKISQRYNTAKRREEWTEAWRVGENLKREKGLSNIGKGGG